MGRVRPLLYGLAAGGLGYVGMDVYVSSSLRRVEASLRSVRHEINPDAPAPSATPDASGASPLHAYRTQAAESFRSNWNSGVKWVYNKAISSLRNPYLGGAHEERSPAPGDEQPSAAA